MAVFILGIVIYLLEAVEGTRLDNEEGCLMISPERACTVDVGTIHRFGLVSTLHNG